MCHVGSGWSQTSLCSSTNDTWMIHFTHRKPRFVSPRLHLARHHLAMLSAKLFRRTNLWPADSCVLFQNEHKFPQTSFSSGSDQYGPDKPGHLPRAAGHKEGLWHIMIWALITWHMQPTPNACINVCTSLCVYIQGYLCLQGNASAWLITVFIYLCWTHMLPPRCRSYDDAKMSGNDLYFNVIFNSYIWNQFKGISGIILSHVTASSMWAFNKCD